MMRAEIDERRTLANPHTAPSYLLAMPIATLRAEARAIEAWCARNSKALTTLLHLCLARDERRAER